VVAARTADVGPLQALIDELEFNKVVSGYQAALFADEQFRRAIQQGAIAILEPNLKQKILDAYAAMGQANNRMAAEANQDAGTRVSSLAVDAAVSAIREASPKITMALSQLLSFLTAER
jgi:ribulose kinase